MAHDRWNIKWLSAGWLEQQVYPSNPASDVSLAGNGWILLKTVVHVGISGLWLRRMNPQEWQTPKSSQTALKVWRLVSFGELEQGRSLDQGVAVFKFSTDMRMWCNHDYQNRPSMNNHDYLMYHDMPNPIFVIQQLFTQISGTQRLMGSRSLRCSGANERLTAVVKCRAVATVATGMPHDAPTDHKGWPYHDFLPWL